MRTGAYCQNKELAGYTLCHPFRIVRHVSKTTMMLNLSIVIQACRLAKNCTFGHHISIIMKKLFYG